MKARLFLGLSVILTFAGIAAFSISRPPQSSPMVSTKTGDPAPKLDCCGDPYPPCNPSCPR